MAIHDLLEVPRASDISFKTSRLFTEAVTHLTADTADTSDVSDTTKTKIQPDESHPNIFKESATVLRASPK